MKASGGMRFASVSVGDAHQQLLGGDVAVRERDDRLRVDAQPIERERAPDELDRFAALIGASPAGPVQGREPLGQLRACRRVLQYRSCAIGRSTTIGA